MTVSLTSPSISKYLVASERLITYADVKIDIRSHGTNAEVPVPWTDLAKPRHFGTIALTSDRLLIVFNPGNVRVLSVPRNNILMAWERTCEGRKQSPNQMVFVLPGGMFCVCELEGCEIEPITALRQIAHAVVKMGSSMGSIGVRDSSNDSPDYYLGDDASAAVAVAATI